MPKNKKQSFIEGAFTLVLATVLVKVIGAVFKIPLLGLIGSEGMGYFMTAYSLFNPIYALSVAGFPVAVSKLVSESTALGREGDVKRILHLSRLLFFGAGLVGSLLMAAFSRYFVQFIGNEAAYYSVLAMSPSIFFACLMASFRGYFEGKGNMRPTAFSQVVEALTKLVLGLGLSFLIMHLGLKGFAESGRVFGLAAETELEAKRLLLPFASAGAVFGIAVSTAFGALYLRITYARSKKGEKGQPGPKQKSPVTGRRVLIKRLISIAIPVSLGAIVLNLTSLIDVSSVMKRLSVAIAESPGVIAARFQGNLPIGITAAELPNYLYGAYQGMAVTIFNLVPSLTAAFGVSALPMISSVWAKKDRVKTAASMSSVLRITLLIAFPAGLGLAVLSKEILFLLYSSRYNEILIAAPMLSMLGLAVIFVAVCAPINSMLQAVGRADLPVKIMLVGGVLKLLINWKLVSMPEINIYGAPVGTLVCYAFIFFAGLICLCRVTGAKLSILQVFLKPLLAAGLCAVAARTSCSLLMLVIPPKVATLAAIAIAAVFYAGVLLLLHVIGEDDIMMLPGGEKLKKALKTSH